MARPRKNGFELILNKDKTVTVLVDTGSTIIEEKWHPDKVLLFAGRDYVISDDYKGFPIKVGNKYFHAKEVLPDA